MSTANVVLCIGRQNADYMQRGLVLDAVTTAYEPAVVVQLPTPQIIADKQLCAPRSSGLILLRAAKNKISCTPQTFDMSHIFSALLSKGELA